MITVGRSIIEILNTVINFCLMNIQYFNATFFQYVYYVLNYNYVTTHFF